MCSLKGKVALVTGSTKGIGKAIALSLAIDGAVVVINSRRDEEEVSEILSEFKEKNYEFLYVKADVTDELQIKSMVDAILEKYNKIDILVNNAGCTTMASAMSLKSSSIDDIYFLNAKSAMLTTRLILKTMIMHRYGRIINISSVAGIRGLAMQSHYAAAKAALIGFTKSVAQEMGCKGITCNVVAPGAIKTSDIYSESLEEQVIKQTPLRRLGTPGDVAGIVTFLASDRSSFITGQVIQVDGGMWM